MSGSFLDTNVLLYAEDIRSPEKRERAQNLIDQISRSENAVLSLQVLQEYFAAATRKLGLSTDFVEKRIQQYAGWQVVTLKADDLLAAITLPRHFQFSIWDALIVHAALISGCEFLYSEDLQHGQRIGNLQIVNPF